MTEDVLTVTEEVDARDRKALQLAWEVIRPIQTVNTDEKLKNWTLAILRAGKVVQEFVDAERKKDEAYFCESHHVVASAVGLKIIGWIGDIGDSHPHSFNGLWFVAFGHAMLLQSAMGNVEYVADLEPMWSCETLRGAIKAMNKA